MRRLGTLALGLTLLAAVSTSARACNEVVSWYADLKGSSENPAVDTQATGKATIVFDFDHPQCTMTIDNSGLKDVTKIELHACTNYADVKGPAIASLYAAKKGSTLAENYQKVIAETDIIKCDKPAVASMRDLANVVLNNQAAVIVYTKAHPAGEIAGKISMHKSYVYSDGAGGYHDPRLHAHPAPSTPSSTPAAPATTSTPTAATTDAGQQKS